MKMKRLSSIPISTILLYFLIILNGCQKDLHNENANSSEIIDQISTEKELKILSMLTNIPFEERLLTIKNDKGLLDIRVWERKQKMTDMLISKIRTKYNLSPDESHSVIHKSVQKYRKELIRSNKIDDWRIEVIENNLFKSLHVDAVNSLGLQNISKAASLNNNIDTVDIDRFTINFVPVYNDLYGFQNLLEQDGCSSIAANYAVSNKTRLDYWGLGFREIRTLSELESANEAISLVYSSYLTAKKACNDSKNTVTDPIGGGGTGGGTGTSSGAVTNFNNSIDDSKLPECMQKVSKKLRSLPNNGNTVGAIIAKYSGSDPNYVLRFESGYKEDPMKVGWTEVINGKTTVFMNQNTLTVQNVTDLAVAATLLHESVHAFLKDYYKTDPVSAQLAYPDLFDKYLNEKSNQNQYQHNLMANQFIGHLALALNDFGKLQNYADDPQVYSDLAWKGLTDTPQFKSLSGTDKKRILDRIMVEQYGAQRDGITKKGTITNCGGGS